MGASESTSGCAFICWNCIERAFCKGLSVELLKNAQIGVIVQMFAKTQSEYARCRRNQRLS